jgi:hypothetical protein
MTTLIPNMITANAWVERPELATYAATVSQIWAMIESELSLTFIILSGSNLALGAAFSTVVPIRNRLVMIRALVDRFLEHPDRKKYKVLETRVETLGKHRNSIVHGLWSIREDEPDVIFLEDLILERYWKRSHSRTGKKLPKIDIEPKLAASRPRRLPLPSLRSGKRSALPAIFLTPARVVTESPIRMKAKARVVPLDAGKDLDPVRTEGSNHQAPPEVSRGATRSTYSNIPVPIEENAACFALCHLS